jgi:cytochrome c-type biogenesis protein CcmF
MDRIHLSDLGTLSLQLACCLALYSVVASIYGARARKGEFVASGRRAALAVFGCVAAAVVILLHALVTHDFQIEYVASYSSSTLPMRYTVAALWGGMAGSLLFWVFVLSLSSTIVHLQNRDRHRVLMPYVTATLMTISLFFLSLLVFVVPAFQRLPFAPNEGSDLNPLLQNYWMMIHPPSLYTGYVTVSVPFAFCIAALVTGQLGDAWIRSTRRWTLFAWFFLTLGNVFGAAWAYEVLGWGGYWAWDPVENAAFMPWLVMTAFLHSVMIQEKKDMLKVWNVSLIILAFALTIFGTFLTRSGVISSVHSFTQSGLGPFFLWFLAGVLILAYGLVAWRLPLLRSQNQLESFFSREASFLFNNLILLGICFTIFWGTVFPVISEWVRGVKITVGPPFFDKVNAPLGLGLLFLTGVGPIIAWRRATPRNLQRNFAGPLGVGVVCGLALFALGMRQLAGLVSFSLCAFVAATIVSEFNRGVRARQALVGESAGVALAHLVSKNHRRYGGYVIHVGVVLIFIGITGSSLFKKEVQATVSEGQTFEIGGYQLRFDRLSKEDTPHLAITRADVTVLRAGKPVGVLRPEKRFYKRPGQPTTEVAIRKTLREDLYLVLGALDPSSGLVTFQTFLNPLVSWLWIGGAVMVLGTGVVMTPTPAERHARAGAQAREKSAVLSRAEEA